jgi:hypothetical protein
MSGAQLLKHLKALPTRERKRVLRAALKFDDNGTREPRAATKRVVWPDVEARAKRISGGRVIPNLVLLEREESPF